MTVYVIRAAGKRASYKIGFTSGHPRQRVQQLQTGSARRLDLVAHGDGSKDTERGLHARFAHRRTRGEWFTLSRSELVEIKRLLRTGEARRFDRRPPLRSHKATGVGAVDLHPADGRPAASEVVVRRVDGGALHD